MHSLALSRSLSPSLSPPLSPSLSISPSLSLALSLCLCLSLYVFVSESVHMPVMSRISGDGSSHDAHRVARWSGTGYSLTVKTNVRVVTVLFCLFVLLFQVKKEGYSISE